MRDEPQDVVQDLLTNLCIRWQRNPQRSLHFPDYMQDCKQVWINLLGQNRKTGKRGKLKKLAMTQVQAEHELSAEERRKYNDFVYSNGKPDPNGG